MYFDRFDICEAHFLIEVRYHVGGWLHERPSNVRRGRANGFTGEATYCQLRRVGFVPSPILRLDSLSDNGREIYRALERRYRLAA